MSAPPYMKLYTADYLADTTHLSTIEHGAYLLLLMAMWRAGGKLPANDAKLAKITGLSAKAWADMRPTMMEFFRRTGGRLTHKRLTLEICKYESTSEKRKEAGKAGGDKTASKNKVLASANATANGQHLPTKAEAEAKSERLASAAKAREAEDWPSGELRDLAHALSMLAGPGLADPAKEPGLTTTLGELHRWREAGCSWSLDVVPTIQARTMRPRARPLGSWRVLTADVLACKAAREAPVDLAKVVPFSTGPPSVGTYAAAAREQGRRKVLAQYESAE